MARKELIQRYQTMKALPDSASKLEKQNRGRDFQRLIHDLLALEGLEPRGAFRPDGEEIDGSFTHRDRVFLLEAKWTTDSQPASSLYEFRGKIDGKLEGTLGAFISIQGYSNDAPDALLKGKRLNMVLFDGDDFEACLDHTFVDVLEFKLGAASTKGAAFAGFTAGMATVMPEGKTEPTSTRVPVAPAGPHESTPNVTLICEGRTDDVVLTQFARRLVRLTEKPFVVRTMIAAGKRNAARLAQFTAINERGLNLAAVVDADRDLAATKKLFEPPIPGFHLFVVEPSLEAWLFPLHGLDQKIQHLRQMPLLARQATLAERVRQVDLEQLKRSDRTFAEFASFLESARGK